MPLPPENLNETAETPEAPEKAAEKPDGDENSDADPEKAQEAAETDILKGEENT